MKKIMILLVVATQVAGFWDVGTTTLRGIRTDLATRLSFFRWQWVYATTMRFWFYWWDWVEISYRKRLNTIAGISIDMIPLSTATILNRRVLISSYNWVGPYMNRQGDLRIWALGRGGEHNTPYRYRVYRVTRLLPVSGNPEHCHGPRCFHQPRHDVTVIYSWDQMYIYQSYRYHYAWKAFIPWKYEVLSNDIWSAGSGFENMEHVHDNYKILYQLHDKADIEDCSKYLPKWWGKFICIRNVKSFPGIQNGGGFFSGDFLSGLGAFEIRYNENRIFVFTDLRYYYDLIHHYAYIWPGQYYEYAYPQWGAKLGYMWDSMSNDPMIPYYQIMYDLFPLG